MNDALPTAVQATEKVHLSAEDCKLGRKLGDCALRRQAGCGSLYAAMMHVLPPFHIRVMLREHLAGDKAAQDWLQRLDDVSPVPHPALLPRQGYW